LRVKRADPDFNRQGKEKLKKIKLEQDTATFFAERRGRADMKAFDRIMNRAGGEPPRPEDEV